MRKQYKNVYLGIGENQNLIRLDNILNVTLENEMLSDQVIGAAEIVEEKIPGRDLPYFFRIDRSPLEFELNLAFEKPLTKSEVKNLLRNIFKQKGYVKLQFGSEGDYSPVYKAIFIGEPILTYIKQKYRGDAGDFATSGINPERSDFPSNIDSFDDSSELTDGYVGYITLQTRCNSPYGYQLGSVNLDGDSHSFTENMPSDFESINYIATITNRSTTKTYNNIGFAINDGNNSLGTLNDNIYFSNIGPQEKITVNGYLKRIYSNMNRNLYTEWNPFHDKTFPIFRPGLNSFKRIGYDPSNDTFTNLDQVTNSAKEDILVEIVYELPRII